MLHPFPEYSSTAESLASAWTLTNGAVASLFAMHTYRKREHLERELVFGVAVGGVEKHGVAPAPAGEQRVVHEAGVETHVPAVQVPEHPQQAERHSQQTESLPRPPLFGARVALSEVATWTRWQHRFRANSRCAASSWDCKPQLPDTAYSTTRECA